MVTETEAENVIELLKYSRESFYRNLIRYINLGKSTEMTNNKILFGTKFGGLVSNYEFNQEIVLSAEKYGFDSAWIEDHLFGVESVMSQHSERTPDILECWTLLSALAPQTKSLRFGTGVLAIPYRNPAVLAKMASTLDVITGGRIILGIGAGWRKEEFLGYGLPWKNFQSRFERTQEAIEIMKMLWTQPTVDYQGKHYKLEKSQLWPKPLQKPHPPIFLGSRGPKMTSLLKEVDGWIPGNLAPEEYEKRASVYQDLRKRRGQKPFDAGLECLTSIAPRTELAREACKDWIHQFYGKSLESIEESGFVLDTSILKSVKMRLIIGDPDECIAAIEEYIKVGVSHFVSNFFPKETILDQIKLYSKKVIPYIRETYGSV